MEIRLEDMGAWKRRLAITIPAEQVERELERVVESYRRRAALPGFRKGKAPSEIIKVRYQSDLEADLLNKLIPDAFEEAAEEEELRPIGPPRFHGIRFAVGQPLSFQVDFEIYPDVEIKGYRDLEIDQEITDVNEEMIAAALDNLRERSAELLPVDRPSEIGDVVDATLEPIDVHGRPLRGGKREEVRMEAGSARLLQEFQDVSVGLTPGAERTVEVRYPEGFQDRELAGQVRRFRLIATTIQEKKLPELDEEFAKSVDSNLDLEGLKAKIRLGLESDELIESKRRLEEALQDRLTETNPFEVPEAMMTHSLDAMVQMAREDSKEVDEAVIRERFRPIAEAMHRRSIILQNVARQESLQVSDEELEAQLESMAEDAGVEVSILRRKMEADSEIDRLRDKLEERKILDFLVSNAKVTRVRKPAPRPEGRGERRRVLTPSEAAGEAGRIVAPSGETDGGSRIITP